MPLFSIHEYWEKWSSYRTGSFSAYHQVNYSMKRHFRCNRNNGCSFGSKDEYLRQDLCNPKCTFTLQGKLSLKFTRSRSSMVLLLHAVVNSPIKAARGHYLNGTHVNRSTYELWTHKNYSRNLMDHHERLGNPIQQERAVLSEGM
jgi:hypothetical protein